MKRAQYTRAIVCRVRDVFIWFFIFFFSSFFCCFVLFIWTVYWNHIFGRIISHIICKVCLFFLLNFYFTWQYSIALTFSKMFRPNGGEKDREYWIMFRLTKYFLRWAKNRQKCDRVKQKKKKERQRRRYDADNYLFANIFFLFFIARTVSESELTVRWLIQQKLVPNTCGLNNRRRDWSHFVFAIKRRSNIYMERIYICMKRTKKNHLMSRESPTDNVSQRKRNDLYARCNCDQWEQIDCTTR